MKHPESELQRACVRWFRLQYPQWMIYANANGGYRSKIEAAIMKGEGVLSGIPDLTILKPSGALYIEMKAQGGRLSENQTEAINKIKQMGFPVEVCYSLDEFIEVIEKYK